MAPIVLKRDVVMIQAVCENEVIVKAIEALLQVDDERTNHLRLEAIRVDFEMAIEGANCKWMEVKEQT